MKTFILTTSAACAMVFTAHAKAPAAGVNKDNLSPKAAVENWKKDLTEGQVASLWDSLPTSYQADVTGLVRDFGTKVDKELYNEAFKTAKAATAFLKSKKAIILELAKESAPAENKEDIATIEANYDSIIGLLNTLVNSDVSKAEGLAKLDIAKFSGSIQPHTKALAKLAALADKNNDFSKIQGANVKVLSESGDKAELEITAEGEEPVKVKVVKVDKRWIPEEIANEWKAQIKEAKASIAKMEQLTPEEKAQATMLMGMVQASIKELDSANTKEELQAKLQQVMAPFMGLLMGQ